MPSVTKEQIDRAKEVDILDYLNTHEPDTIKRQGNGRYILRDHDSFVISKGKWCWNSRGIGCKTATALNYLIKVRGISFADAVIALSGDGYIASYVPPPLLEPTPFTLPPRSKNNDRAIAYLLSRGIDKEIIDLCVRSGTFYESISKSNTTNKLFYNCAFIGHDKPGKARFACIRATCGNFRRDMDGSDKRYAFCIPAAFHGDELMVAESPIDALSLATLKKMESPAWDKIHYLSLSGTSSKSLVQYLKDHTEIGHITMCLDNDSAGQKGTQNIIAEVFETFGNRELAITIEPPPVGNDYNDVLQALITQQRETKGRRAAIFI